MSLGFGSAAAGIFASLSIPRKDCPEPFPGSWHDETLYLQLGLFTFHGSYEIYEADGKKK